MDKSQAINNFNHYIGFLSVAKKELKEIKKITNLQEQKQKVIASFEKHSRNFLNAKQYLDYCRGEINQNDFWEYSAIVNELKTIRDNFKEEGENNKNNNYYICEHCKKTKSGQYWYNKVEGTGRIKPVSKVKGFYSKFCSQECLNSWRQKNLKEPNGSDNSKITCHHCHSPFSGQHWTTYDERKKTTYKFCSQTCCDSFCYKYNQVVIAWNTLILERKNLSVPNFPTWEELETKQANGELESYVEEVKKRIGEVRQSSLPDNSSGKEVGETVSPLTNNDKNSSEEDINLDKSNQIKSNQIKSNQIKSNQIKSNQIKSNQIKSNIQLFTSNSITMVELTTQGLVIHHPNQTSTTYQTENLSPELQTLKNQMEKQGTKRLSKEDLEKQLRELEGEKEKGEEQKPAKQSGLGLKIGIGIGCLVVILGGLLAVILVKKNKKK